jgi:pimeloyl-ACP methyl ester carboxylesterase
MTTKTPSPADVAELMSAPAQTVGTKAGRFEYADAGLGPAVLSLHPAVGGWDAGLGMAAPLWANGLRVISPSRPGYLGTPPQTGPTPLAQADALAALLDYLGIDSCAVIGHCNGGLVGYLLAARHPDRVSGVVAISTPTDPDVGVNPALLRIGLTRPVAALVLARDRRLLHRSAEAAARRIIGEDSTLPADAVEALAHRVMADPARAAFVTHVWATRTRRSRERLAGIRIDGLHAQVLTDPPLADITCPTLVVHGGAELLALRHAERAATTIPDAELRVIPDGCHHGLWLNDDAAQQQSSVLDWIRKHATH